MKSNEWKRIFVPEIFKIEMQNGGSNSSDFLQNWSRPEIRSLLFNLKKFQDFEKSTPELCRMHGILRNDKGSGSLKLLKFKYWKEAQITQSFCWIASTHQKLGLPLSSWYKFQKSDKDNPGLYRMHWNLMNGKEYGSLTLLKLKYRGGTK